MGTQRDGSVSATWRTWVMVLEPSMWTKRIVYRSRAIVANDQARGANKNIRGRGSSRRNMARAMPANIVTSGMNRGLVWRVMPAVR